MDIYLKTRQLLYLVLGTLFMLSTILFVGQFYNPEDGDRTLFIKHKPTLKQYFYSPVAYHKFSSKILTDKEVNEERAFQEFITNKDLIKKGKTFTFLGIVLFQMSMSFLICGFFSILTKLECKNWQLVTQFIISLVITAFGVTYILHTDNKATSLLVSLVILMVNLVAIFALVRFVPKKEASILS